jgi:molecular chaperone GrpE (heat shock protein)
MPTAFTERIEKGEITNFKDFAKLCTRAFSAAIHMRDESLDSSYRKRYVDPYYLESLDEVKHELLFLEQYPHEAYESEKKKIIEDLEFCEKEISKRLENKKLVDKIFKEANEWVVPTDEHIGFRNFVMEQLSYAQKDCDISYYDERISELKNRLETMSLDVFLKEKYDELKKDFEYSSKKLKEQEENCEESNIWIEALFKSLGEL